MHLIRTQVGPGKPIFVDMRSPAVPIPNLGGQVVEGKHWPVALPCKAHTFALLRDHAAVAPNSLCNFCRGVEKGEGGR